MKKHLIVSFLILACLTESKAGVPPFYISAQTASYISDAVYIPKYNHVFFFGGSAMMPYDMTATQTVSAAWYSLGELGNIDASVLWDEDHLLLFADARYVIYEIDSARIISDWVSWPSLPDEWNGKIDACVRWSEDEIMFFSGKEYLLYSISQNMYKDRNYFTAWEGWPANWQDGLQSVLKIGGNVYFLRGGEYLSLDTQTLKLSQPKSSWAGR